MRADDSKLRMVCYWDCYIPVVREHLPYINEEPPGRRVRGAIDWARWRFWRVVWRLRGE